MNPEVKKKWVTALKSKEYKQTTGYLHTDDGFCCLGVLCDIAVKDGVISSPLQIDEPGADPVHYEYDDDVTGELPTSVMQWAGLDSHDPVVTLDYDAEDYDQSSLASLNDDRNWTFDQIADVIEREL